jgi:hypothetical protein
LINSILGVAKLRDDRFAAGNKFGAAGGVHVSKFMGKISIAEFSATKLFLLLGAMHLK